MHSSKPMDTACFIKLCCLGKNLFPGLNIPNWARTCLWLSIDVLVNHIHSFNSAAIFQGNQLSLGLNDLDFQFPKFHRKMHRNDSYRVLGIFFLWDYNTCKTSFFQLASLIYSKGCFAGCLHNFSDNWSSNRSRQTWIQ